MLIQEFCRVTGLTRDTVRFYVRRGLLKPVIGAGTRGASPANRYQVFDAAQVERARLIRSAQRLGFTLSEIALLAEAYERSGLTRQQRIGALRVHLATLDAKAALLDEVRRYLAAKLNWLEGGEHGPPPSLPAASASDTEAEPTPHPLTGAPSRRSARVRR